MRPADLSRMDIAVRVLLQSPIVAAKNESGEDDSLVPTSTLFETLNVVTGVRRIADNQQLVRRTHALESFDDHLRTVLRLEPRNVKHVAIGLDAPATDRRIDPPFDLGAIRDHR